MRRPQCGNMANFRARSQAKPAPDWQTWSGGSAARIRRRAGGRQHRQLPVADRLRNAFAVGAADCFSNERCSRDGLVRINRERAVTAEAGRRALLKCGCRSCGVGCFFRFWAGGGLRPMDGFLRNRRRATLAPCMIGPTSTCLATARWRGWRLQKRGFPRSIPSAMRGGIGARSCARRTGTPARARRTTPPVRPPAKRRSSRQIAQHRVIAMAMAIEAPPGRAGSAESDAGKRLLRLQLPNVHRRRGPHNTRSCELSA